MYIYIHSQGIPVVFWFKVQDSGYERNKYKFHFTFTMIDLRDL